MKVKRIADYSDCTLLENFAILQYSGLKTKFLSGCLRQVLLYHKNSITMEQENSLNLFYAGNIFYSRFFKNAVPHIQNTQAKKVPYDNTSFVYQ